MKVVLMMAKNGYLAQRDADRRGFFRAGLEIGRQQIIDMMCLVLHDQEYVGKDTFGKDRLLKVVQGISDKLDLFDPAWQRNEETDYYQEQMDKLLAECFGVQKVADPFSVRYEHCYQFDYKTGKWK